MLSLIAAVDNNMGIGKNNRLLASIKPDLKYFKRVTEGHTVVMGYNTYLSLPNGPLPNRNNIVITSKNIEIEDVTVLHSIEDLLDWTKDKEEEIFVIGGASIYEQLITYADKLYLTHIFHTFEADAFFPDIKKDWKFLSVCGTSENIKHEYKHMFAVYGRK